MSNLSEDRDCLARLKSCVNEDVHFKEEAEMAESLSRRTLLEETLNRGLKSLIKVDISRLREILETKSSILYRCYEDFYDMLTDEVLSIDEAKLRAFLEGGDDA